MTQFTNFYIHRSTLKFKSKNNNNLLTACNTMSAIVLLLTLLTPSHCEGEGEVQASEKGQSSFITTYNDQKLRYFYRGDENSTISCVATGVPLPQIIWQRIYDDDDDDIEDLSSKNWNTVENGKELNCTLRFPSLEKRHQGIYRCLAINKYGNDTFDYDVKILNPDVFWRGKPWIFVIYIVGLVVVAFICNFIINKWCIKDEFDEENVEDPQPKPKQQHSNSVASAFSAISAMSGMSGMSGYTNKGMEMDDNNNEMGVQQDYYKSWYERPRYMPEDTEKSKVHQFMEKENDQNSQSIEY